MPPKPPETSQETLGDQEIDPVDRLEFTVWHDGEEVFIRFEDEDEGVILLNGLPLEFSGKVPVEAINPLKEMLAKPGKLFEAKDFSDYYPDAATDLDFDSALRSGLKKMEEALNSRKKGLFQGPTLLSSTYRISDGSHTRFPKPDKRSGEIAGLVKSSLVETVEVEALIIEGADGNYLFEFTEEKDLKVNDILLELSQREWQIAQQIFAQADVKPVLIDSVLSAVVSEGTSIETAQRSFTRLMKKLDEEAGDVIQIDETDDGPTILLGEDKTRGIDISERRSTVEKRSRGIPEPATYK